MKKTFSLILILGSSGCFSLNPNAAFEEVSTDVLERTGHRIAWNQGTEADEEVDSRVKALLCDDLSSDTAVQIALLSNQNLQAEFENLGIGQADLVEAGLLKNPVFTGDFRFGAHFTAETSLVKDFVSLVFLPLRKRIAEARYEAVKLEVTKTVLDLAHDTRKAFYMLQGAEQKAELERTVLATLQASADFAKRQYSAGNINDLQIANERTLYEEQKLAVAQADLDVVEERSRLNSLMGLWGIQTDWKVVPKLPEIPLEEVNLQGLERIAIERRPELAAARAELEALGESLGLTDVSRFIPELAVGLSTERESEGNWLFGPAIDLSLPIFNQGQPMMARARAEIRQAQKRYIASAVEIRSDVVAARSRLNVLREKTLFYKSTVLPLRTAVTQETQVQYNAMLVGLYQLLQTKREEIDAGAKYVESLRDYWIARTELERATGGLLQAEQPLGTDSPAVEKTAPAATPKHHHGA